MGSKINRGFLFYFLLLLGIIFGAFIICIMLMIFVPNFSLFGMKYFNADYSESRYIKMDVYSSINDTEKNKTVNIDNDEYIIENIEINSNVYSIEVVKSSNNAFYGVNYTEFVVIFNTSYSGFTTSDSSVVNKLINYYEDTNTLKIDITGPEGFIQFGGPGSITLQIPPNYNTNNINLKIKTDNLISIGDSVSASNLDPTTLNLKSIDLNGNGIGITNYATIGLSETDDCSLKTKNASISINTTINAKDLTVIAGETTVNFNKNAQSLNLSGDLNMITNNTFIHLGDVVSNRVLLKNTYGKFYVTGDVIGNIIVDQNSYKCDYEFKNITGDFTFGNYFDEKMIENGNIKISGKISGETTIATTGYIDINRIQSLTKIKNTNGLIKINIINAAINIDTINGNIDLGNVVNRISYRINLVATGSASVNTYFDSFVYSENTASTIITKNGAINIYLVEDMPKNIIATTTANLTYLGVNIKSKSGEWIVGNDAKHLNVFSNANINISNR